MKITSHAKTHIKQFEGLRTKAYRCSAGIWTIGYGHTKDVWPNDMITEKIADKYFDDDILSFERTVEAMLRVDEIEVTQCQFDALVSLAFNIGPSKLHVLSTGKVTKLWLALKRGDSFGAAHKILYFNKSGGVPLKGLTERRLRESKMFLSMCDNTMSYDDWKSWLERQL